MVARSLFTLPTAPLGLPLPFFITPASGEVIWTRLIVTFPPREPAGIFLGRPLALAFGLVFGSSPTNSARAPARS